ncbi:MAG: L-alanine exporter AlaE [Symbiopectobacterium sp.]
MESLCIFSPESRLRSAVADTVDIVIYCFITDILIESCCLA